jgi:hypothetical protein
MAEYNAKTAAVKRWLRVIIPQIPAVVASALGYAKVLNLPAWVVPALIFVGSFATALDKLLRDLEVY